MQLSRIDGVARNREIHQVASLLCDGICRELPQRLVDSVEPGAGFDEIARHGYIDHGDWQSLRNTAEDLREERRRSTWWQ